MENRLANLERVIAQARRLEDLAESIYAETQCSDAMETISGAWDGAAAQSWLMKEEALRSELRATAEAMQKTANSLRETALTCYAEQQEREDVQDENG